MSLSLSFEENIKMERGSQKTRTARLSSQSLMPPGIHSPLK